MVEEKYVQGLGAFVGILVVFWGAFGMTWAYWHRYPYLECKNLSDDDLASIANFNPTTVAL